MAFLFFNAHIRKSEPSQREACKGGDREARKSVKPPILRWCPDRMILSAHSTIDKNTRKWRALNSLVLTVAMLLFGENDASTLTTCCLIWAKYKNLQKGLCLWSFFVCCGWFCQGYQDPLIAFPGPACDTEEAVVFSNFASASQPITAWSSNVFLKCEFILY